MKKSELDLLEKVLDQEIDGAINRHAGIYQTKSKIAKKRFIPTRVGMNRILRDKSQELMAKK